MAYQPVASTSKLIATAAALTSSLFISSTSAQAVNSSAQANTWAIVGAPQVSAQQLYRGQGGKVG